MLSTEPPIHKRLPISERQLLAGESLFFSDDQLLLQTPPHLISFASMSLHSMPPVNMLNLLSTDTWCALNTRTGDQHVIYMQGHNNCIPKALWTNIYTHYPRFNFHAARLVASLPTQQLVI